MSRFDYSEWQHPAVQGVKWGQPLIKKKMIQAASATLTVAAVMSWRGRGDMIEGQRAITACFFYFWASAEHLRTSNLSSAKGRMSSHTLSLLRWRKAQAREWHESVKSVQSTLNSHKTFKILPAVQHNKLKLANIRHETSVAFSHLRKKKYWQCCLAVQTFPHKVQKIPNYFLLAWGTGTFGDSD